MHIVTTGILYSDEHELRVISFVNRSMMQMKHEEPLHKLLRSQVGYILTHSRWFT